jgi:hypothetical protein
VAKTDGIEVLSSVWGHRKGWVFVPAKDGKQWMERSFLWPKEKRSIEKFIKECINNERSVYWCPTVFTTRKRIKENVEPKIDVLWADLDEVNPREIEPRPSIAWESSPNRYQCLWLLKSKISSNKAEGLNRGLTYLVGADKGGWDLTQVLRIPGLRNWKYDDGPKGRLLWNDGNHYSYKRLKRLTERVDSQGDVDVPYEDQSADGSELLKRYSKSLDKRAIELLLTPEEQVEVGDRSDRLWELECLLAEAGIPTRDIITMVRESAWNKFEGRRNEEEQLEAEVYKAKDKVKSLGRERAVYVGPSGHEVSWSNYEDIMGRQIQKPRWMIEGIWQDKGHGIVAGEPKTYKSVLSTDIAVSVASGQPLLNSFRVNERGPVLIIQEENHPYLVQDRLRKMSGSKGLLDGEVSYKYDKLLMVKFPPVLPIAILNQYGFNLTDEAHREMIQKKIKQFNPSLVIFDPLYLMLGGTDENNSKELRPILNWLIQMRYAYNTGIMLVHHFNKSGSSPRGGQRMLGSTTLHAWVESALYCSVANEVEHKIRVEREFRSFQKPKTLEIQFNMGNPGEDRYEPTVNETNVVTEDSVIAVLRGSAGMTEQEILSYTEWPRSTFKRFSDKLIKDGVIIKIGGGRGKGNSTIYKLKEDEEVNE